MNKYKVQNKRQILQITMQQSQLLSQPIRQIQVCYYSAYSNFFINTAVIELLVPPFIPKYIKVILTPFPQPNHPVHGQTPFLCINNTHIVKSQQLWDFLLLTLNIDIIRKYQFLTIAKTSQQLSQVATIASDLDNNPYFLFISPWRKYKRHYQLEQRKSWFHQNTLYFNPHDNTLNHEHFLYKLNTLAQLFTEYEKPYATKPQYLNIYRVIISSFMRHLKFNEEKLYLVASEKKELKDLESYIIAKKNQPQPAEQERHLERNVAFSNVKLNYLEENPDQEKKQGQEEIKEYLNEREKFNQSIFKPVFATVLFGLAMWAFK